MSQPTIIDARVYRAYFKTFQIVTESHLIFSLLWSTTKHWLIQYFNFCVGIPNISITLKLNSYWQLKWELFLNLECFFFFSLH